MKPTLVVLAAGIGSRFGRLKQLEEIGPTGETILDYAVYDAIRHDFGKVVFVIRSEIEERFRADVLPRFADRMEVDCVMQRLDLLPSGFSLPEGRTKPWGTGQAVLAADGQVHEPFGVVNADDFYGHKAFESLAGFLRDRANDATYAMVGYTLRDTLADVGPVSRALCQRSPDGWLQDIVELPAIERHGADARHIQEDGSTRIVAGGETVSMNIWGFGAGVFGRLREAFKQFLEQEGSQPKAEFYLPTFVRNEIGLGRARVEVLGGGESWFGMTHLEDKLRAQQVLRELIDRGEYPSDLWG